MLIAGTACFWSFLSSIYYIMFDVCPSNMSRTLRRQFLPQLFEFICQNTFTVLTCSQDIKNDCLHETDVGSCGVSEQTVKTSFWLKNFAPRVLRRLLWRVYWHENQTEIKELRTGKKSVLHGDHFLLFCCQKQNKLMPLSAHRVYLKINCQKATQILVLTLRRQAIFSPINQSAEERNLLSWVMVVVMMVGSGGVIKCVWLEAPIAQNLSTKSLGDRCGSNIRAGRMAQVAECGNLLNKHSQNNEMPTDGSSHGCKFWDAAICTVRRLQPEHVLSYPVCNSDLLFLLLWCQAEWMATLQH